MEAVKEKLERARRELLDLGLRNTLINHRTSKARGLDIVDEKPEHVYRILVSDGKTMSFQGIPEPKEESDDLFDETDVASLVTPRLGHHTWIERNFCEPRTFPW